MIRAKQLIGHADGLWSQLPKKKPGQKAGLKVWERMPDRQALLWNESGFCASANAAFYVAKLASGAVWRIYNLVFEIFFGEMPMQHMASTNFQEFFTIKFVRRSITRNWILHRRPGLPSST